MYLTIYIVRLDEKKSRRTRGEKISFHFMNTFFYIVTAERCEGSVRCTIFCACAVLIVQQKFTWGVGLNYKFSFTHAPIKGKVHRSETEK